MATPTATTQTLIASLGLPDSDRTALEEALLDIPDAHGLRGVWTRPVAARLAAVAPHAVDDYQAWAAQLGPLKTFSWVPVAHVVLNLVRAATLARPDDSVSVLERTRHYLADDTAFWLERTMLRVMIEACGGEMIAFLEAAVPGTDMFFNHGEMSVERHRGGRATVHAEGHHALADRYMMQGFFEGVARYFGAAQPQFEIYGPTRYSVHVHP